MYICNLKLDYIYDIEFIFIKKLYFSDDTTLKILQKFRIYIILEKLQNSHSFY